MPGFLIKPTGADGDRVGQAPGEGPQLPIPQQAGVALPGSTAPSRRVLDWRGECTALETGTPQLLLFLMLEHNHVESREMNQQPTLEAGSTLSACGEDGETLHVRGT